MTLYSQELADALGLPLDTCWGDCINTVRQMCWTGDCSHDWIEYGTNLDDHYRNCWLCGKTEDL